MIVRAAIRELGLHPVRTGLAVAGVAVAGAMLLDMLMLSSGLQSSFADLLQSAGYDIRVAPAGSLPLETEATIADASRLVARLASSPDVDRVAPVLGANLSVPGDTARSVFALGVDPGNQGVYRLLSGRDPGPGEVLLGEGVRGDGDVFGGAHAPGDSVSVAPLGVLGASGSRAARTLRVSGTAEFLYVSRSEEPIAIELGTLQELTGQTEEVSFLMVAAAEGVDPESLAATLAARHDDLEIVSIGTMVERAERRLSYFRQLAIILGTVSLIVAALLIGTIASVSISDRYGTIAATRAIGVSRRSIMLTLLTESLIQAFAAVVLGIAFGLVTSRYLERILSDFPGLPEAVRFFVPDAGIVGLTALMIVVTAGLASLAPAWRVTRMPIATTLHREEP